MQAQTPQQSVKTSEAAEFLRSNWKIFGAFVLAGLAAAVLYLNVATYTYEVALRVSPTETGAGNMAGRLGGLAAVAGIRLGADKAVQPFELYVEAFYSPEVARRISANAELMHRAFPEEWNASLGKWEEPKSVVRTTAGMVKRLLGIPVYDWRPPDAVRLQEYIEEEVILVRDPKRSVTSFSMDHRDPAFASELLTSIHNATDNMVRERTLRRANSYIEYLSRKLAEVTLVEHREALAETLGEQERVRMMSSSDLSYAAEPLGAPLVSPRPTRPRPLIMLVLGLFGGAFAGVIFAVGRRLLSPASSRQRATQAPVAQ